jgi:hypothetical protein
MGQKINPTIFRLGFNKIWKTEFFEKKKDELPLYIFKDLEIRYYIEKILQINGILLNDYKQQYNGYTINLYISYFVTSKFTPFKEKICITNTHNNNKKFINNEYDKKVLENPNFSNYAKNISEPYKIKQYLDSNSIDAKFSSRKFNNSYYFSGIFFEIFQVLNLFSKNKLNIVFNFSCINKDLNYLKATQKKILVSLQKFKNMLFFQEGINLLFYVTCNPNSAKLLIQFLVFELKKTNRHKFFLSFLKQTLITLINSSISQIKGIKINVSGKLNGVPKAQSKTILIGDMPVQTISAKLDYSQAVAQHSKGTYGIKVWIINK